MCGVSPQPLGRTSPSFRRLSPEQGGVRRPGLRGALRSRAPRELTLSQSLTPPLILCLPLIQFSCLLKAGCSPGSSPGGVNVTEGTACGLTAGGRARPPEDLTSSHPQGALVFLAVVLSPLSPPLLSSWKFRGLKQPFFYPQLSRSRTWGGRGDAGYQREPRRATRAPGPALRVQHALTEHQLFAGHRSGSGHAWGPGHSPRPAGVGHSGGQTQLAMRVQWGGVLMLHPSVPRAVAPTLGDTAPLVSGNT